MSRLPKNSRLLLLGLLLVPLIGVVLLWKSVNSPAIGTITKSAPPQGNVAEPEVELEQLDGRYISFTHPTSYKVSPKEPVNAAALEQYVLVSGSFPSKLLAVTVTRLPSGSLADDSSYKLRQLQSETYLEQKRRIDGDQVSLMIKRAGFERVTFWPHNGMLATIVLSSGAPDQDELEQEYARILESWRWQ
ncbi:MAG TPA: hypothetical protein VK963_01305 [Candidatus Saccharimonadales bacterium]|nr:hypothetical protein [Candidatus Saccharimonadales bacterium]